MKQPPLKIVSIVVGAFEVNCHLVAGAAGDTLVVDPGADAEAILEALAQHHLTPRAYLLTHGHMDHVSALAAVQARHPAPAYLHAEDACWAFTDDNAMTPYYPRPAAPATPCLPIEDGTRLAVGGLDVAVLATPGHTPGCVCFHLPAQELILTGDTLFEGSVGRTDLPGGDSRRLRDSLRRLKALSGATRVLAGHGDATTIARECATNPYLK